MGLRLNSSAEHGGRSRRAKMAVVAVLCLMYPGLSACGQFEIGQTEAAVVIEKFSNDPYVSEVNVSGATKWPVLGGSVSGTIYAQPGLAEDKVRELSYRIGDSQRASRFGVEASGLYIDVDGITTPVLPDRGAMDKVLPVLFELRDDPVVNQARVGVREYRQYVDIYVSSAADVMAMTRNWAGFPPLLQAAGMGEDYELLVVSGNRSFRVDGRSGDSLMLGVDAWESVADEFNVLEAKVDDSELYLRIGDDDDIGGALAVARDMAEPGLQVMVERGNLVLGPGADSELAQAVMKSLPASVLDSVKLASVTGSEILVEVLESELLSFTGEALLELSEIQQFDVVRIDSPRLRVGAAPEDLQEWILLMEEISANTSAPGLNIDQFPEDSESDRHFIVTFYPTPPTGDELQYLARALRPHATDGTSLFLTIGLDSTFEGSFRTRDVSIDATPLIDEDDDTIKDLMGRSGSFADFVSTWNAL